MITNNVRDREPQKTQVARRVPAMYGNVARHDARARYTVRPNIVLKRDIGTPLLFTPKGLHQ